MGYRLIYGHQKMDQLYIKPDVHVLVNNEELIAGKNYLYDPLEKIFSKCNNRYYPRENDVHIKLKY